MADNLEKDLKDLEKSMNNDDFKNFIKDATTVITDSSFMKDCFGTLCEITKILK